MVTVIIPVYNTANFISESVKSALVHGIVTEIILIEDGSIDNSLVKCKNICSNDRRIILLTHPNNENKGASASRNLGIQNASQPYICFLDADDYMLSNRFDFFNKFLGENREFDGIYEAIQYFNGKSNIYSISNPNIKPQSLIHFLIRGTYGHFHTNGIIIKKETLFKAGLFKEELELHEDSDLWIKLAFYGHLLPGNLTEPVAMVRKHEGNRIWKGTSNKSRIKQWKTTWKWAKNEKIGFFNKLLILRKIMKYWLNLNK